MCFGILFEVFMLLNLLGKGIIKRIQRQDCGPETIPFFFVQSLEESNKKSVKILSYVQKNLVRTFNNFTS